MATTVRRFIHFTRRIAARAVALIVLILVLAAPAMAQPFAPQAGAVELSGPRFGFTMLGDGVVDKLEGYNIKVKPVISQFGWQFEKQLYSTASGLTAVTEWVALVGGLDQGVVLPSGSWLVGLRTRDGFEFGVGPNVTPAGVGLVLATGATVKTGALNIPLNVAFVPSRSGLRLSIVTGFSLSR